MVFEMPPKPVRVGVEGGGGGTGLLTKETMVHPAFPSGGSFMFPEKALSAVQVCFMKAVFVLSSKTT